MIRKIHWLPTLIASVIIATSAHAVTIIPTTNYNGTPISFGLRDLNKSLTGMLGKQDKVRIYVSRANGPMNPSVRAAVRVLPSKSESFAIAKVGHDIAIVGRDDVGTMYGCFELAERLGINGRPALDIRKDIVQSPAVEFRAVNPFLTLPYKVTDDDWWFLKDDYWEGYLDQLARARINWVDLHGMYDIRTTGFPNIYPYFIKSEKFPGVGVPPEIADRNLAMLNKVVRMAKDRGIRFAIMSYAANWDGQGMRKAPYEANEANLSQYTREVVRKMIESCPDLAMIGFRIGETGCSPSFFKDSYIPAIREAGRKIDLYTRTWRTHKPPILEIGREFPGRFFIEIKYNGEQFGPPYIIAGGRMSRWKSYSYQDYYNYPRAYKIIYQLRANGTHRVFPWGNPTLAARANQASLLGGAIGLCVEPMNSYYPKYDFRHKDDSPNRWYKWQYQRDWYWYNVWGRTAYDPSLKDHPEVWKHMLAKHFGKPAAEDVYNAMNWASMIVPDAYSSYSLGPDHRNHAPELEWGGDVKKWATGEPFDTQNIQSPREFAERLMKNDPAGTATPLRMSSYLANEARMTRKYIALARAKAKPSPQFNDLTTELTALSRLGDYYAHKLDAAAYFALMEASSDVSLEPHIKRELQLAKESWDNLAAVGDANYKPFVDTLRMKTEEYTWSKEGEKLSDDPKALEEAVSEIKTSGKSGTAPALWPGLASSGPEVSGVKFKMTSGGDAGTRKLTVTAVVKSAAGVDKVFLKTKPFPSQRSWSLTPMTKEGDSYIGEATVLPEGLMWCIEAVDSKGGGSTWPDFREETPYKVVLPWNAPMPPGDQD